MWVHPAFLTTTAAHTNGCWWAFLSCASASRSSSPPKRTLHKRGLDVELRRFDTARPWPMSWRRAASTPPATALPIRFSREGGPPQVHVATAILEDDAHLVFSSDQAGQQSGSVSAWRERALASSPPWPTGGGWRRCSSTTRSTATVTITRWLRSYNSGPDTGVSTRSSLESHSHRRHHTAWPPLGPQAVPRALGSPSSSAPSSPTPWFRPVPRWRPPRRRLDGHRSHRRRSTERAHSLASGGARGRPSLGATAPPSI